MTTYRIHESNIERLSKKLNRIANKCRKYGCEFHYAEVGEEYKTMVDENGNEFTARYVLIEAEGKAVINGWKFVASIDYTEKGNIINKAGTDVEIPERYYEGKPVCEHCGNKRVKHSFIVMNEGTGEFKQVGRSCLADFTYGMSAEGVAAYIACFDELIAGEAPMEGCSHKLYIPTDEYLRYVAESIRHFGYVKTDMVGTFTTKERAERYWIADNAGFWFRQDSIEKIKAEMKDIGFDANSADAVKTTQDALKWLDEQAEDNNYMHNLKVACANEYVTQMGILASLFPTWDRELEREARRKAEAEAAKVSEYVGEVGKRVEVKVKSYGAVTSYETQWGFTIIWKIVDEDGNVYIWKTGNDIPEDVKTIKGTVKAHKEYNGTKQTELTRCKCA